MSKTPQEFYGQNIYNKSTSWSKILQDEKCPFLNKKCVKQRKSNSSQTIGTCVVGFQNKNLIICPHRFLERKTIFLDAIKLLKKSEKYLAIPEISMPGGHIDYFLVGMNGNEIVDYLGLEIQALDTTGSGGLWDCREDLRTAHFKGNYEYGINWKMSAKTILIQIHHKVLGFETLGKKLVLVIQKEFFEYITKEFRTRHLIPADAKDSVHFHVYDCLNFNGSLHISLDNRFSTDMKGIDEMLKLGNEAVVQDADVIARITEKLPYAVEIVPIVNR